MRQIFGSRDRQCWQLLCADIIVCGQRFTRSERPDHGLDLVALDELLDLGARLRRNPGAIPDEKIDLAPRQRVVSLAQELRESAFHVDPARSQRPRLHGHQTQPDRFGLGTQKLRVAQHRSNHTAAGSLNESSAGESHIGPP